MKLTFPFHAVSQAVIRRPLTEKTRVKSHVSPCEICGGHSGSGSGFTVTTAILPYDYHSTNVTYTYLNLMFTGPGITVITEE